MRKNSGFTLVEILIVVIILGILAAIVIPQFTNASQDARESALVSQLQTLRSQIELYKLQHNDALPTLVGGVDTAGSEDHTNWNCLTIQHTLNGKNLGPYMQAVPKNAINQLAKVVTAVLDATTNQPGAAAADVGFIYDYNTGTGTGRIWGTGTDKRAVFPE